MNTAKRLYMLLPLVVIGFLLTGCRDPQRDCVKAPARIDEDLLPCEEYPQIVVIGGLKGWIAAGSNIVQELGPPLKVTVPVRALTDAEDDHDGTLHVQYRFFFLDEKGVPLNRSPDWHLLEMPSRTQVFMQANATDLNAMSWRLEIRPAR